MTTVMRLNLKHFNLRPLDPLDSWVEKQIMTLAKLRQISEANIRLVRLENASPAYQVYVHLVTPGPDVFAESRDHTLRAAIGKAMVRLREEISNRTTKRMRRIKTNLKARRGI